MGFLKRHWVLALVACLGVGLWWVLSSSKTPVIQVPEGASGDTKKKAAGF